MAEPCKKNKDDRPAGAAARRRQAEDALRESEERHRIILRTAMDGFWLVDTQGRLLEVNEAYCRISGYSESELLAMHIPDLVVYETAEDTAEHIRKIIAQGEDRFESRHRRKDGSVFDVDVSVQHRPIKGGLFVAFFRDITERKRAEEALRKSEERLRLALKAANQGFYDLNVQTGEAEVSPEFAAMLGYDPAEFHETNDAWIERMHPEDRETVAAIYRDFIGGKISEYHVEVRQRTRSGDWKWILSLGKIVQRDARGEPLRMLGTYTDITERKRTEAEKEKLQEQLRQAQKMESVGRLAGGVAHDFNNMLSAILGHTELAMMGCDPSDPIHADLKAIEKSALRSADLTRQLLAFARRQPVMPKVLDLNDSVTGMLKMLQRLIGEDIDLVWMPGAGLWPVRMDPSQIDQILANLCVNARDAIAGVGKVTVATENTAFDEAYCAVHPDFACGEYAMLAVTDNGCGLNKDVLEHLFEPFFTTKELGRGTGLGLSTVYGIVKQNNGFINVHSEPGKGTAFKIYLPRFVGEAAEANVANPTAPPQGRGETVLVVEDEALILSLDRAMLERLGYTVLSAGTPAEALRQAKVHAGEIQLLVTDVIMPEMNGRELAKLIRDITPGLKCLFTSGYTANLIAHNGVLEEGVNFLQKPFSINDLASKVRQALER
jgi:two-component system cell cycle sensor histidine kinase/response regulator CckA